MENIRRQSKSTRVSEDKPGEDAYFKYPANYSIHDAAAQDDVQALAALSRRKDVNSFNEEGQTALHISSFLGHHDTVTTLLTLAADVNAQDKRTGRSALHNASLSGHTNIVDTLLKHGAVVYDTDKVGAYPMHLAAQEGHCDVIETLWSGGAPVECPDNDGAHPAHYAAKHNTIASIHTLHRLGADLQSPDKNQRTPMHYAAEAGSCKVIKELAELGASLEPKDKDGETPLFLASRALKTDAIGTLAALNCDLYAVNNEGEFVIHLASRLGHWQSIWQLYKCHMDIGTVFKKGRQPVHIAAENGCSDVLLILKKARADLNAEDKNGDRPLHYAVRADQETVIQTLVELGADINAKGKIGNTALHVAVKGKKTRLVQLLASLGADCNAENENGLFPLYYACLNEDRETAKCLLSASARLNKLNDDEGMSMLHVMAEEEQLAAMTVMKELKANMNVKNSHGRTCVHIAAEEEQAHVVNALKDNGADIDAPNKVGLSALHVAVMNNKAKQIDLLYTCGASLNVKSKNFSREPDDPPLCRSNWPPKDIDKTDYWKIKFGMTPLHLALLNGHIQVFKHLVHCGADINVTNETGESLFHLAVMFNMTDWFQLLISLGVDRNCEDTLGRSPLHYAVHAGKLESIRLLLKYGARIHASDRDGRTPLHYVAQEGQYLMLPIFTSYDGAAVDCRDKGRQTPLHLAAERGQVDTLMELVQLGADIHAKDNTGNTAVHLAAAGGRHETIVQLASLGADTDARNDEMKTPLHIAGDQGRGEEMEYLLMCGANPALKAKTELLPSTYRLVGPMKSTVNKLIKQSTARASSKYKPGEISYQGKMVSSGKPMEFERLSVAVNIESEKKVSAIVFFHRTPADEKDLDISIGGLEEIISDVYELRVMNLESECTLTMEIPMDGYPGVFESFLKTADGTEFPEHTTTEENGVPMFVAKIPIGRGTAHRFAVVVRPRRHSYTVTAAGDTVLSEIDRRIRLEVPAGTVKDETRIDFQVMKTDNIERSTEPLLVTDVVKLSLEPGKRLRKKVMVTLPLHTTSLDEDQLVMFAIDGERDIQDERKWKPVQSPWRVENGCVTFTVSSLSMYVGISTSLSDRHTAETKKRLAKTILRRALQRETSVVFFSATTPKKGSHLTIFECTTPGRFPRRREFWQNEGFHLHPQIPHSGHFVARPNQMFTFQVSGNVEYLHTPGRKLKLAFNPMAYKYQSFYLTRADKKKPAFGEILVFTQSDEKGGANDDTDVETCLTSIPVEMWSPSKCAIA